MNYLDHLEKHCGEFTEAFPIEELEQKNVQILKFKDAPFKETYTIASLGLLFHPLQTEDDSLMHQEIMMSAEQPDVQDEIIYLLWQLAEYAMRTGHAFNAAEYYPLPEGIFEKYQFSSVYVTSPVYFDESFCLFETDSNVGNEPDTVLPVWFVPIFESEEKYIEKHGADQFEDLLFETDELVDFNRKPLI
ncbi:suppressor of fused domain protein [uncultured Exiguobacterium sp.]|uniref:suppressor of fused domain protein n=1 Tax=uncultured Exiguobacterium sp. TaxID=202669 RepID=UPI0037498281